MHDGPGSVRKPGGLGACARCQALVSASELTDLGDGKVCPDCRRKFRPAAGPPARPSWSSAPSLQSAPPGPGPRLASSSPIAAERGFGSWSPPRAAAPLGVPQNAAGGPPLGGPAAYGDAAPGSRAVGTLPQATAKDGGHDPLAEYAELRRRIAAGEDTLPVRRRAGEIASRAGLLSEAIEHYQRCVELNPTDDRLHMMLENVRRAAGTDRRVAAAPEPERKVLEEAPQFWTDLGSALAYPLEGSGRTILLVGGGFLGVGQLLGSINTFGLAVSVMIFGYCACWLFDVINATGAGKKAPPEMPGFTSFLETYVSPLFSLVACGLVGFAPFVLSLLMVHWGWLPDGVSVVLPLICFALGMFTMPMTLLLRAMYQSWSEPLNPALVLGSIGRVLPDYVAAYVALSFVWVLHGVATVALFLGFTITLGRPSVDAVLNLDGVRMVSWVLYTLVSWPLFLYTWSLQGHLLGRLYRQGMRRLGWFVPGTTKEGRAARRFSAALAAGALAATVVLCLGAWGATRAWTLVGGSANAASLLAKCPVKPGSRLTYFWESTDGGGRLMTYCFEGLPDGKLRVTATVRTTENPEFPSDAEELGVIDPANGEFTSVGSAYGTGGDFEGRKGEHVAFYGPARTSIGSTFVNEWPVRGADRWKDAWSAWKVDAVDPQRATAVHYYDQKSGVLVGRFFAGVGFQTKTWLVAARDVAGVTAGPPPSYPFGSLPLDAVLGDPGVATGNGASGVDAPDAGGSDLGGSDEDW